MTRGQITGHPLATTTYPGLMSAVDKALIANFRNGWVNILDYGADNTGVNDCSAAFAAAIAALPNGGTIYIPQGAFKLSATVTVATNGIQFIGCNRDTAVIWCSSATIDMFVVNAWYVEFRDMTFTTSVTRTAGYAINAPAGYDYCVVRHCNVTGSSTLTHYNGINMSNLLMVIDDVQFQNWTNVMISLTAGSVANQYISNILASNAVQAVAGIQIISTGSLMIANSDIVNAGNALDLIASSGSIPSIECVNTFFDTSVNGVRFALTGSANVVRCKFTNCWFGSHTSAGVLFNTTGGGVDGLTFVNCDFYGSGNGIYCQAAPNNWSVQSSRFAGNTTAAINIAAASAAHFPQIIANNIGAQGGFGNNGTGIIVAAGTYLGLRISNNIVPAAGNTTILTLGAVTVGVASNFAITDNAGINPRGNITTPAVPATTVVATNTTGFRCLVFLRAGTITVITINGVVTGITAAPSATGTFLTMLEPGGTIAMTFSVAPTWVWIGS